MSLLRKARTELTGAVRSVRYDLGRRPVEPPAGGPDITSTGMSTFGGHLFEVQEQTPAPVRRGRRKAAAVTGLGVLTVVGAAGVYLGVVNGLGSVLNETPAAAGTFSPPPAVTETFTPNTGIGRGPAPEAPRTTPAEPGATVDPVTAGAPGAGPIDPAGPADPATTQNASPIRTTIPTKRECACGSPPVPTPTAPATTTSTSPSAGPSSSTSPSGSGDPSPSETSATPSESPEPSDSAQARHRRRHP
jgi:hypothetical protein